MFVSNKHIVGIVKHFRRGCSVCKHDEHCCSRECVMLICDRAQSTFTFLKKTSQINISRWNSVVLVICSRQTKKRKEKEDEYGCCLKAALGLLCPEAHRCNVKNVTFRCMIDRFPQLWSLCKYNYATLKHPPFLGVAYMLVHASYVGTLVHIKIK